MKLKLTSHKYKQQQQQLHHYVQHYHYGSSIIFSIIICWTYIQNNNKHATHGTEHRRVTSGSECPKRRKGRERRQEWDGREGCAVLSPSTSTLKRWDATDYWHNTRYKECLMKRILLMFLSNRSTIFRTDLSIILPTSLKKSITLTVR